jgi:ABC-type bacteriocin/lantibiotic exporter with double-glycine peptidase domain
LFVDEAARTAARRHRKALVIPPEIVLFDEATTALDAENKEKKLLFTIQTWRKNA